MKKISMMLLSFLLSVSMLSGCNSNPKKDAEDLKYKAKAYGKLIRWKAYEDAASYIKTRDGSSVELNTKILDEIRVTKYEVVSIVMNEQLDEASVIAEIAYYHERVNSVHDIRDKQVWWKDESGVWYMDGQLPPFIR
ncbi:MAG: hypothetical protein R8G33_08715 [Gammaproteobacteria bacterium]|nr:hypothetical protein [Gammaproteobacteria bacterium]